MGKRSRLNSAQKLLRNALESGATAEDATQIVLDAMGHEPLKKYAYPFLLKEAATVERGMIRRQEDHAFAAEVLNIGEAAVIEGQAPPPVSLADVAFRIGGELVPWPKATRSQHAARVLWLQTRMDGLAVDRDRHQAAVDLLTEYGVDCLEQIDDWESQLIERASGRAA